MIPTVFSSERSSFSTPSVLVVRWLLMFGLAVVLFLLVDSAHAQQFVDAPNNKSSWTVYAFGNAQAVSDVFRAIANFTNSGPLRGLVALLAVIGVLSVGISSGFSTMIARRFISYAVFVFLVVYLLFGMGNKGPISVSIEVEDTVDATWKAPVTVPAVVGIPASLISSAGYWLTKQAEASFPIPDELKMSKGAPFNLAATLISDMSKARIQDPNIANSFAYYIQDCFVTAVAQNQLSAQILLNSTNFLEDIKVDFNSIYVNTTLGDPVGVAKIALCKDAYAYLKAAIDAQGSDAASFMTNASSWHSTPALSVVNSAADQVAAWASNGMGSGLGGGSLVKQAAVLAAFKPAFGQAAAATGNSDFLTTIAVTQATETQKNSWLVGAEIFNRMMGYFFAVLQVFIYALTPLILAAALIPSLGMSLLKNFAQVLIWLALWQPMLAIVNFVVLSMQQANLGGALAAGGSMGFTMNNIGIISERTANLTAAATMLGTMVPVLAWAFVKGSVDFSRMVGSAVGENFAQSAGNTLTTGNYSLNSGSMDSFTANKTSISAIGDFGNGHSTADSGPMGRKFEADRLDTNIGGVQPNIALSDNQQINDMGASARQVAAAQGGATTNTLAMAMQLQTALQRGENVQNALSHVLGSSISGGVGGSLGPGRSPINPSTGKPDHTVLSQQGLGGGDNGQTPPQQVGDQVQKTRTWPSKIKNFLTALGPHMNGNGSVNSSSFKTDGSTITAAISELFSGSESFNRADSGFTSEVATQTHNQSSGYGHTTGSNITMNASHADRVDVMRAAWQNARNNAYRGAPVGHEVDLKEVERGSASVFPLAPQDSSSSTPSALEQRLSGMRGVQSEFEARRGGVEADLASGEAKAGARVQKVAEAPEDLQRRMNESQAKTRERFGEITPRAELGAMAGAVAKGPDWMRTVANTIPGVDIPQLPVSSGDLASRHIDPRTGAVFDNQGNTSTARTSRTSEWDSEPPQKAATPEGGANSTPQDLEAMRKAEQAAKASGEIPSLPPPPVYMPNANALPDQSMPGTSALPVMPMTPTIVSNLDRGLGFSGAIQDGQSPVHSGVNVAALEAQNKELRQGYIDTGAVLDSIKLEGLSNEARDSLLAARSIVDERRA